MNDGAGFAGRRVLVVEDDAIIAIYLERLVEGLGGAVAATVGRVDQALEAIEREQPDAAILDVNLGRGRDSYPVAQVLADRHVPFLFVTGYGKDGVREEFRDHPVLDKPVREWELARTLAVLCAAEAQQAALSA
jgi:CheY-like chemotaxis protein